MHLKISSAKWRPFCLGGDELKLCPYHCQTEIYLGGKKTETKRQLITLIPIVPVTPKQKCRHVDEIFVTDCN